MAKVDEVINATKTLKVKEATLDLKRIFANYGVDLGATRTENNPLKR